MMMLKVQPSDQPNTTSSNTNLEGVIPESGPLITTTLLVEDELLLVHLDCGSQLNIGNNDLVRLVASKRAQKNKVGIILYPT